MKKILTVSSDPRLFAALEENLGRGYIFDQLTSTCHLFEMIELLEPHVLLVDFILDDENGGAISHRVSINPATSAIPVILLTDHEGLEQYAGKFGCVSIIPKTALFPQLTNELTSLLEQSITG